MWAGAAPVRTTPARWSSTCWNLSWCRIYIFTENVTHVSHCKNHLPTLNQEFQLALMLVEAVISRHLAWSSQHDFISACDSEWPYSNSKQAKHTCTVEPLYNEVLRTMRITLLYQVSRYIRVKIQRNIKSWDQQKDLVIRGFCYIRPLYNEVPLYTRIVCTVYVLHALNIATRCHKPRWRRARCWLLQAKWGKITASTGMMASWNTWFNASQ